jgi:hypothetical protein
VGDVLATSRPKVIGIGLNKTGTKTLAACLRHWGYRHRALNQQDYDLWAEGRVPELMRRMREWDSFEDWPWPLVYEAVDLAWPGSQFLLTRRSSPEVWFQSLCKHAEHTGPTWVRERIYGSPMPQGHQAAHTEVYQAHLEAVRSHFSERPAQLLEVCWEEGDGWASLGGFLKRDVPDQPFPHRNRSQR